MHTSPIDLGAQGARYISLSFSRWIFRCRARIGRQDKSDNVISVSRYRARLTRVAPVLHVARSAHNGILFNNRDIRDTHRATFECRLNVKARAGCFDSLMGKRGGENGGEKHTRALFRSSLTNVSAFPLEDKRKSRESALSLSPSLFLLFTVLYPSPEV